MKTIFYILLSIVISVQCYAMERLSRTAFDFKDPRFVCDQAIRQSRRFEDEHKENNSFINARHREIRAIHHQFLPQIRKVNSQRNRNFNDYCRQHGFTFPRTALSHL